jgi:hypothetical protein
MSKPSDNDVIWTMREAIRAWLHEAMSEDEMIARIDRVLMASGRAPVEDACDFASAEPHPH